MMYGPYPGKIVDWHDGDTCHIILDLGFGIFMLPKDLDGKAMLSCRVYGINAPELNTVAGKTAVAYANSICPPGTRVTVHSYSWDKYGGRFDGVITLPDDTSFADAMIAAGQAVEYTP